MPVYSPQYGVLGEDDRLRSDVGPAQSCKDKAHDCGIQQHAKAHLTHDDRKRSNTLAKVDIVHVVPNGKHGLHCASEVCVGPNFAQVGVGVPVSTARPTRMVTCDWMHFFCFIQA